MYRLLFASLISGYASLELLVTPVCVLGRFFALSVYFAALFVNCGLFGLSIYLASSCKVSSIFSKIILIWSKVGLAISLLQTIFIAIELLSAKP